MSGTLIIVCRRSCLRPSHGPENPIVGQLRRRQPAPLQTWSLLFRSTRIPTLLRNVRATDFYLCYESHPELTLEFNASLGFHPPLSPYGQKWKEERRMYHSHLGKDAVKSLYRNDVEFAAQEYVLQGLEAKRNLSGDYFL